MSIKLQTGFDPVAAYRLRGKRYAIYVAAKLALVVSIMSLSLITLGAQFASTSEFEALFRVGISILNFALVLTPYVVAEALHWWYQERRARRAATGLPSA